MTGVIGNRTRNHRGSVLRFNAAFQLPRSASQLVDSSRTAIGAKLPPQAEEAVMLQMASRLLAELPLILLTAVATHLFMSFAQTPMRYKLGHLPIGGKFFRDHINFHHAY